MLGDLTTYALGSYNTAQGAASESKLNGLTSALETKDTRAVEAAAKEFEAVFVSQMLRHMFEGVGKDGLFYAGNVEEMRRGMLMEEYGKVIANSGGIGIADHVKAELLKLQEVSHG